MVEGNGEGALESHQPGGLLPAPKAGSEKPEGFREYRWKTIAPCSDQAWLRDSQTFSKNVIVFSPGSAQAQMGAFRGLHSYCREGKKGGGLRRNRSHINWMRGMW